jgi:hypothetical protein
MDFAFSASWGEGGFPKPEEVWSSFVVMPDGRHVTSDCDCSGNLGSPLHLSTCRFQPYWAQSYFPGFTLRCGAPWVLGLEAFVNPQVLY